MSSFEFSIALEKADVNAEAPEQWRFIGLASTGCKDRQGERVSEKAVASMAAQARSIPICMASSHQQAMYNPMSEVGIVDDIDESDPEKLIVKGFWDQRNPWASFVHGKLNDEQHDPGWKLSVGGKIRPSDTRMEFEEGTPVRVIDDLLLDHIYLCRGNAAVNQETSIVAEKAEVPWTEAVFKAAADLPDEPALTDCAELDGCEPIEKASFSEKEWGEVVKEELPASCFLYVGDPEKKSTWKFPVYEGADWDGEMDMFTSRGPLNINALSSAAGYLSSTDPEVRSVVEPKLRKLYEEVGRELPPSLKGKAEEAESMSTAAKAALEKLLQLLSGGEEPAEEAAKSEVEVVTEDVAADAAPAEEPVEEPAVEYVAKADFDAMVASVDEKLNSVKTELVEAIQKAMTPDEGAEDPVAMLKADVDGRVTELGAKIDGVVERFEKAIAMVEEALGQGGESAQPEVPVAKASVEEDVDPLAKIFDGYVEKHKDWLV